MRSVLLFVLLTTLACSPKEENRKDLVPSTKVELSYATGLEIRVDSVYSWVEVKQPYQGAGTGMYYLLVPKNADVPEHPKKYKVIRTPVSSLVCTSTTHIPLLDYLDESAKLVGFPTTDYIASEKTRKFVDAGRVADLGIDEGMNIELLATLQPELVMGYTRTAEYGQFKKIEALGIPVIINAEYLEQHPLGRAEWIRFAGLLFGKEAMADSVFKAIADNYNHMAAVASNQTQRPTALSGVLYGDAWFLPGGKNYASTILKDAGIDYVWRDDQSHGFLELSFESVYANAKDADLWIGVASFQTLKELAAADSRYTKFKSFTQRNVYSYDARRGAKGGNEYLELGSLRPDIILKDLVKIAHPELIPEYELYFYKPLP